MIIFTDCKIHDISPNISTRPNVRRVPKMRVSTSVSAGIGLFVVFIFASVSG